MNTTLRLNIAAFGLAIFNLSAATRYVALDSPNPTPPYTNWATAAHVIQDAVDAATDGDTVLVTNGVYAVGSREIGVSDEFFPSRMVRSGPTRVVVTNAIRLESVNGPLLTAIEGEQSLSATRCLILGTNATLSGFTLTHGATNGYGESSEGGMGGGVWCVCTNSVLTNCSVAGNSAARGGGVLGGTLYNCTVTDNSAGNGGGTWAAVLYDCLISGNRSESDVGGGGGAVGGMFYNCVLTNNSARFAGGGAYGATLTRCKITGNSASQQGGGTWLSTQHGCTLSGNSAPTGGGAYYGDLVNCTVTLNTAAIGGGTYGSTLYNCIVFFNHASGGGNVFGGSCEYSCTTPLPSGPGNISSDPQLTSASHLALTSPCIGAGSVRFATGVDIDGEPWANPPAIGADQPGPVSGPLDLWIEAGHTNVATGCEVTFVLKHTGEMLKNVWDFGDTTRLTNAPVARHAWRSPGVYTVRLTGYNDSHPEGVTATTAVVVRAAARYYVNLDSPGPTPPYSTWETAARVIQDAVDAAQAGDTVLVANGVYAVGGRETLDEDGFAIGSSARVVITKPITLLSVNGPEVTAIEGSRIPTTFPREPWRGVRCVFLGNNAVLSGFTLTNGTAARSGGGGVYCEPEGMVTNCVLTGNLGQGAYGGTLYDCTLSDNEGSGAVDSTLYDCTLTRNRESGVAGCTLYNCTLSENVDFGEAGGGGALGSILYNCTLTGNEGLIGGGASYSTLYNCTVIGNSAPEYVGGGVCECMLYNCIVRDNIAGWKGGGAWASTLFNCTLTGNSAQCGGGDFASTLFSCTLTGNSASDSGGGACSSTLHDSIVYYNTAPKGANYYPYVGPNETFEVLLQYCCTTPLPTNGVGNIDADPRFVNPAAGDFHLRPDSPCIDAGTNLSSLIQTDIEGQFRPQDGNKDGVAAFDIGAYEFRPSPMTLHVSLESTNPIPPYATWATAANVIQDAVDAARDGDTVLVTNGVYSVGSREVNVLDTNREPPQLVSVGSRVLVTNSIRLESVNGPLVTTIVGSRIPDTVLPPWQGIRCVLLGGNAVLSGFTLTNGTVNKTGGAGIYCGPEGVVTNCILTGNFASRWSSGGGGAYGGTLYNCTLSDNRGCGARGSTLYGCTLTHNWDENVGGAWDCTLYYCTLTGNFGAAGGAADSTLYNCVLSNNEGYEGAGGVAVCTLYDCIVTGNPGYSVGDFYNCTVIDNGDGIWGTAFNFIIYYNSGGNYGEWTTLSYCCTSPLPTNGIGNITGPPLFMDMAAGDFRLREDSPCIDAGTNLLGSPMMGYDAVRNWVVVGYITDPTDILGNTRFIDGNGDGTVAWDIGAYEFDPASMQLVGIPDTGLLAVIRAALNKPTGDLTVGDMERLTALDASRQARGSGAPLIHSLAGLEAARNLTQLNLSGGGAGSPNIAVSDFSPLAGLTHLTTLRLDHNQLTSVNLPAGLRGLRELHLAGNQLASLTLPEGLTGLRYLDVRDNPITYLAVPESMDLSQLVLEGFPIEQVTIIMLRIGPASVRSDGSVQLPLSGTNGQVVRVQRSTNLVDWEDWRTVTLNGTVKELLDQPADAPSRFYRVAADKVNQGQ